MGWRHSVGEDAIWSGLDSYIVPDDWRRRLVASEGPCIG